MRPSKPILSLLGGFLLAAAVSAQEAWQPEATYVVDAKPPATAKTHMVAAANPHAASIGLAMLRRGGTAADAAVAVQMMLNLVEPQSSGIGGGAFALYWDAGTRDLITLDGRETAPAAATPEYWLDPKTGQPVGWFDAVVGGRSVGVPGTLKLLETLHGRYGKLDWASLLEPTILLAESGFPVSPRLAKAIAGAADRKLGLFPDTRAYFFTPDGRPRAAGSRLRNPDFAETLRRIAAEGPAPLYTGDIARDIVQAVRTPVNPGILTREDMAAYEVKQRPPVCILYRTYDLCGMGPPTSGGIAVAQILGMLSFFDLSQMGAGADTVHLFLEASKLAYADRARYLADPDFVPVPVQGLLDPAYLAKRVGTMDPYRAMPKAEPGTPPGSRRSDLASDFQAERPGTSHFVIVDKWGNALSMTTTIETGFGSRVMVGGFLLNNELTDFARAPEKDGRPVANRVEGGKRPRSSMSPTIVFKNGKPHLLIGSPGGSRIISYVAQATALILDGGLDPQAAVSAGHAVNRNGVSELEKDSDAEILEQALLGLGHEVRIRDLNSGLHAILVGDDGTLYGGADPRREGIAVGD